MKQTISFYRANDPYGYFSNFAPYPIEIDGQRWATTEHYFQAQKFHDAKTQKRIQEANSPSLAARLGRRLSPLRKDWESIKVGVMRRALYAKFTQHPKLQRRLLETGDAKLVEHTRRDAFWGDGGGGGKNWLGRLLMELREAFAEQAPTE